MRCSVAWCNVLLQCSALCRNRRDCGTALPPRIECLVPRRVKLYSLIQSRTPFLIFLMVSVDVKRHLKKKTESHPVPNIPYGLCGRKALMVSVNVKRHLEKKTESHMARGSARKQKIALYRLRCETLIACPEMRRSTSVCVCVCVCACVRACECVCACVRACVRACE